MGDPRKCCILGICCPPPEQVVALRDRFVAGGMDPGTAQQAAEMIAPEIREAHAEAIAARAQSKRKR